MTRWLPALLVLVSVAAGCAGCEKSVPLPKLGQVPQFSLTDQSRRAFTDETLKGRVWVAAFMFTRCPTICPALTRAMRGVQVAAAKQRVPLQLVSVSVDPDNDTPAVLTEYAKKHAVDLASWTFVTGDSAVIQKTAEHGFKIAVSGSADESKEHFGLTHGSHLVLVDQSGAIRGYYRSSDAEMLEQLVADAKSLE
jgi:protein SCO1/2